MLRSWLGRDSAGAFSTANRIAVNPAEANRSTIVATSDGPSSGSRFKLSRPALRRRARTPGIPSPVASRSMSDQVNAETVRSPCAFTPSMARSASDSCAGEPVSLTSCALINAGSSAGESMLHSATRRKVVRVA